MLDFDTLTEQLIVGSAFRASDVPSLVELKVSAVVSLQAESHDPVTLLEQAGIKWARVPCEDFRAPSLGQLEESVETISTLVSNQHRVYLHCFAGVQRAVTVAACYLIASDHVQWNARSALDEVISKRRGACPLREQIDAVLDFDRYVRALRS